MLKEAIFLLMAITLKSVLGNDFQCYPNQTIHFTNPNTAVYTYFTAFYDVAGSRTNCTGVADSTKANIYFDCASTTATVTAFFSDRTLSDDFILGGTALAYTFHCGTISDYNITVSGDLDVGINTTHESLMPTFNITGDFFMASQSSNASDSLGSTLSNNVTEAVVGESVFLILTAPVEYDIVPLQCNASGSGGESVHLITNGCTEDSSLMSSFEVTQMSPESTYNATLHTFKFYGSDTLLIVCDVMVCVTRNCTFTCGGRRKRQASADIESASRDNVNYISIARRLRIIDRPLGGSVRITGSFIYTVTLTLLARFVVVMG